MSDQRPVILITGCSSGIGAHCAHALHRRGWRVFASARRAADVERLQGDGLETLVLDVADEDGVAAAVATLLERTGGRLDAVFCNAGYGQPGAVEDLPREALRAQFETNVLGAQAVARHALPVFRRQGHGRVVMHSSLLGFVAMPYRGAYNASKFALEGLTDTLRQELHGSGIHVSLIQTGPVTSRFRANAEAMFRRWIDAETSAHREAYAAYARRLAGSGRTPFSRDPEAVLRRLAHALESPRPKARYHVTVPSHVFKALSRLLPTRLLDRVLMRVTADERR
ncbi:SDR family NAD(P)-dependent oxidoreductase [Arhodomonas sp. KWT2]|uniref:SDR family NAD(P)-dependent oxidoreductase n=1 Tax=unclassified Arhodomonas TaxID=2621637 RepID=UPI00196A1C5F|nr:SDR family NAD(P)-dependent oxidoreductase [Arhodomonas sp. KWT]